MHLITATGATTFDPCVTHGFVKGMYTRHMLIPQYSLVVGHRHADACLNFCPRGSIMIYVAGRVRHVVAPDGPFESGPETRKLGFALEETEWVTVHSNPDDCHDIVELEHRLKSEAEVVLGLKDDLDTFQRFLIQADVLSIA